MTTALARKFRVEVTTDLTLAGGWTQLNGISSLKPSVDPNMVDTSAYDTNGWDSFEITGNAWSVNTTFFRRTVSGVYDPAQEIVRACQGQFGDAARVGVRWFDKNGGPESFQGVAIVKWERAQDGVKDVDAATVTLSGDWQLYPVANPGHCGCGPGPRVGHPLWCRCWRSGPRERFRVHRDRVHDWCEVRWRERVLVGCRFGQRPRGCHAGWFGWFGPGGCDQRCWRVELAGLHPRLSSPLIVAPPAWLGRGRHFTANQPTAKESAMPHPNPIPERVAKSDLDAALRVLGIASTGTNLISLHFDLVERRITVLRNVKHPEGGLIAGRVTVEVPIGGDA